MDRELGHKTWVCPSAVAVRTCRGGLTHRKILAQSITKQPKTLLNESFRQLKQLS